METIKLRLKRKIQYWYNTILTQPYTSYWNVFIHMCTQWELSNLLSQYNIILLYVKSNGSNNSNNIYKKKETAFKVHS